MTDIKLTAADGFVLGAYKVAPTGTPKGAIVVLQEIFGVNPHIRSVTESYAKEGYLAIAPALYDRSQPNVQLGYSQDDVQTGLAHRAKLTMDQTMADIQAAVNEVAGAGKVGGVGYCWGGLLTWLSAARVNGIAACAGYYSGGIGQNLDVQPKCPVIMHFGEQDHAIPMDDVNALKAKHPEVPVYTYAEAGHGFNCTERPSYHAPSAKLAFERTLAHFKQYIG
ncbi:MAG TPA: dienelactone hydrolase family protein [Stellaceae bacterium]|nr:dienelactone hydrolase family protein [Stellaceae bacterium]